MRNIAIRFMFYWLSNKSQTDQKDGGFGEGRIEGEKLEREGVKELYFVLSLT
jgi:hypothetical protein